MTEQTNVVTESQYIEKMYDVLLQIDGFNEELKQIKSDAKESGFDAALLAKVAKAKVDDKVSELKEKTEKLQQLLDDND